MKTVTLWSAPNTGADNSSGFSAVPSGRRNEDGEFTGINQLSDFWTATYSSPQYATSYLLSTNNASVYMNSYANKGIGSPIRCISD